MTLCRDVTRTRDTSTKPSDVNKSQSLFFKIRTEKLQILNNMMLLNKDQLYILDYCYIKNATQISHKK